MQRFVINSEEAASLEMLIAEVTGKYHSVEDPKFLAESTLWAQELPRRLRAVLNSFRLNEPDSAHLIVSGFPIDDKKIGLTPEHWNRPASARLPTLEAEIYFVLTSSLLGDCIGWRTQQGGRIVHDVMPIRGMEQEQIGTGSEQPIWWHTEDAFHPMRGDYLGMMCMRNPDCIPTTFASLERVRLDSEDWQTLFEPHYAIKPDLSHSQNMAATTEDEELEQTYHRIVQMQCRPEKIALLSGDLHSPYIRIDHYFMDPVKGNPNAQKAFEALVRAIDAEIEDIVLGPGDICFIDNFKAVHGRRAFKARYDGHDRWLKRVNITRDLRKSRTYRAAATSRIIH
jgi:Fe(II)/alpha-ketoglutarate-dependent arginine beta-hydroxylase